MILKVAEGDWDTSDKRKMTRDRQRETRGKRKVKDFFFFLGGWGGGKGGKEDCILDIGPIWFTL